jgi:hypothetical protein
MRLRFRVLVPKTEAGYRQVERQVVEMRRLGLLPYDFITDGTRSVMGGLLRDEGSRKSRTEAIG